MTDIGGGIFSLVVTAIFLRFWKPKNEWHFDKPTTPAPATAPALSGDGHAAEAAALLEGASVTDAKDEPPLTFGSVSLAWGPYILMSVLLLLTGLVRQAEERRDGPAWSFLGVLHQNEGKGPVYLGPIQTNYRIPVKGCTTRR
jgi:lactate permease